MDAVNSVALFRPDPMKTRTMLTTGVVGALLAAACCFTPVLTLLLIAVGLSALVVWIDYVAFPAIAVFLGITGYALYRKWQEARSCNVE